MEKNSNKSSDRSPLVSVVMGSKSDWETMSHASKTLDGLGIAHENRVYSAHRTPDQLFEYLKDAESRGVQVIIAAAGGAAHLGGVIAAKTMIPVLGVPMQSQSLQGLDSLLSMVQMPAGIPVATLAIGKPGAINAALFAAAILARSNDTIESALSKFREEQRQIVLATSDPSV
jgi:5-(carboxyamino)imidazole ribonucleotide mutase